MGFFQSCLPRPSTQWFGIDDMQRLNEQMKFALTLAVSLLIVSNLSGCQATSPLIRPITGCQEMVPPVLESVVENESGGISLDSEDTAELLIYIEALERCSGVR